MWHLIKQIYILILNAAHTFRSDASPCSFRIRITLSAALYTEFHLVWLGWMTWSSHSSWTISALLADWLVLLYNAWHFASIERVSFLCTSLLSSALEAYTVATILRRWHTQRWCLGRWYSNPQLVFKIEQVSWTSTPSTSFSLSSVTASAESALINYCWLGSPYTLNALIKLYPLSVVVLTIFSEMPHSK